MSCQSYPIVLDPNLLIGYNYYSMNLADRRAEHAQSLDPVLIPGIHAAPYEVAMTAGIIRAYIRPVYQGPISLVGSRAEDRWLSLNRFRDALSGLPDDVVTHWFNVLNAAARQRQLARHEVAALKGLLPSEAPEAIGWFLDGTFGVPGADIDLLLEVVTRRPAGISQFYSDPNGVSNQIVDIFPR